MSDAVGGERGGPSATGLALVCVWEADARVPGGERARVTVRGELDITTARRLQYELRHTFRRAATAVDLDLAQVPFCDCSGLNALLALRRLAEEQGKTLALVSRSPAVERLLDLTRTSALFDPPAAEDRAHGRPEHPTGRSDTAVPHPAP